MRGGTPFKTKFTKRGNGQVHPAMDIGMSEGLRSKQCLGQTKLGIYCWSRRSSGFCAGLGEYVREAPLDCYFWESCCGVIDTSAAIGRRLEGIFERLVLVEGRIGSLTH